MSLVKSLIYWFNESIDQTFYIMKLLKAKQLSTGYTPLAMVFIILQKSKHFLTLLSIHFCSAHVIFVTLFFRILVTLVTWFSLNLFLFQISVLPILPCSVKKVNKCDYVIFWYLRNFVDRFWHHWIQYYWENLETWN